MTQNLLWYANRVEYLTDPVVSQIRDQSLAIVQKLHKAIIDATKVLARVHAEIVWILLSQVNQGQDGLSRHC